MGKGLSYGTRGRRRLRNKEPAGAEGFETETPRKRGGSGNQFTDCDHVFSINLINNNKAAFFAPSRKYDS